VGTGAPWHHLAAHYELYRIYAHADGQDIYKLKITLTHGAVYWEYGILIGLWTQGSHANVNAKLAAKRRL